MLLVGKRLECLGELERTPRQYKKKSDDYWLSGIKESRTKRPRLINQPMANQEAHLDNIADLTPEMIKARLKEMGITTRVRNLKRLQEMYRSASQSATNF